MVVFNKTIIPLALVGYEMIIANSYPTRARGIIVKYLISPPTTSRLDHRCLTDRVTEPDENKSLVFEGIVNS